MVLDSIVQQGCLYCCCYCMQVLINERELQSFLFTLLPSMPVLYEPFHSLSLRGCGSACSCVAIVGLFANLIYS